MWRHFVCPLSIFSRRPRSARFCAAAAAAAAAPVPPRASFKAPPNIGPGRGAGQQANPYKSWEHMNHTWLILMCVGCLAGGVAAGHLAEVDESKLRPKFSKEKVFADIAKTFEFRPDLAATGIRVAFLLAARRAGFVADSVDESCAVVAGLEDIAGVMNQLAATHGVSTEDAAALVAVAAVRFLSGPAEEIRRAWRWGRNDTDVAPPRKQPADGSVGRMPVATILRAVGGLSDEECVALFACHSVGEFHEHVSGLDGVTHTGGRYTLSNAYYRFLLENEKKLFPLEVPRTEDNKAIQNLPTDFRCLYTTVGKKGNRRQCVVNGREIEALLRNKAWRSIVERFATDDAAWAEAFQSGFTKMIDSNFKRLRPYPTDEKETTSVPLK